MMRRPKQKPRNIVFLQLQLNFFGDSGDKLDHAFVEIDRTSVLFSAASHTAEPVAKVRDTAFLQELGHGANVIPPPRQTVIFPMQQHGIIAAGHQFHIGCTAQISIADQCREELCCRCCGRSPPRSRRKAARQKRHPAQDLRRLPRSGHRLPFP